jgi:hypothetical protein
MSEVAGGNLVEPRFDIFDWTDQRPRDGIPECKSGPNRALPYSITLSARATNVGGTVTLSELNQVFGKAA